MYLAQSEARPCFQASGGSRGVGLLDLPPEVVTQIFNKLEYLEALRTGTRVCRGLRRVSSVSILDLTGYVPSRAEAGPGRSLDFIEKQGHREYLLQWLGRYGHTLWELRAALGTLSNPQASAIIESIAVRLGSRLSHFEISSQYQHDQGGLETTMLANVLAGMRDLSSLELPLTGHLTDSHLQAIAHAQPRSLDLSYARNLDSSANSFAYTKDGWKNFEHLSCLSLTGGRLHHTWGLADAPITNMCLSHGSHLSLAGLKSASSLTHLFLEQPDLQHSSASPWIQQLKDIASLRSLHLRGQPFGSMPQQSATQAQLFQVSQVKSLGIYGWAIADGWGMARVDISKCPQLTELHLSGSHQWPNLNFEALPCLKSLTMEFPASVLPSSLSTLTQLTRLHKIGRAHV